MSLIPAADMAQSFLRPQPAHELYRQLSDAAQAATIACPILHHHIRLRADGIRRIIDEADQRADGAAINGAPLRLIHTVISRLLRDTLQSLRLEQILRQQHAPPRN